MLAPLPPRSCRILELLGIPGDTLRGNGSHRTLEGSEGLQIVYHARIDDGEELPHG